MIHSNPRFGNYSLRENGLWLSDVTLGNASTSKHGLLPKLSGNALQYLDGTGAFSTPAGYPTDSIDSLPASPNAMDDEFNDTSGMSGPVNGLAGKWAWRNQGSAGITFGYDCGFLRTVATGAHSARMIEQSTPGGTFQIMAKVSCYQDSNDDIMAANDLGGMFVRNVSGNLVTWGPGYSAGELFWGLTWTNETTPSTNVRTYFIQTCNRWVYLNISYDGTFCHFAYSFTGIPGSFMSLGKVSFTPTQIGLVASTSSGGLGWTTLCSWFRRFS